MKTLLMMSLTGGALALVVMLLRALLGKRLHPRLIYLLWLPVLLSLLIPLRLESPVSVRNVPQVQWAEQSLHARMDEPIAYGMVTPPQLSPTEHSLDGLSVVAPDPVDVQPVLHDRGFGIDAYDVLALVWTAGALIVGGYIAFVNLRFRARVRRSRKALAVPWILARQMGSLRVYVSKVVPSPCLVGVLRPFVVVTPQALEDENRLVHVLTHERMHKAQLDPLWSLLRMAVLIVHWFNPIVWIAASLSRSDCENACDALTIRALGEEQRVDYGKTLLSFLRAKPTATALVNAATTMAQSRRQIRRRISLIAKKQRYAWIVAALAITLTLTGCALTMTAPESTDVPDVQVGETPPPQPVEEAATLSPTPMPVTMNDEVRAVMANYEAALMPWITGFEDMSEAEVREKCPELTDFDVFGRRNVSGDAYAVAVLNESEEQPENLSFRHLSVEQYANADEKPYYLVKEYAADAQSEGQILRSYEIHSVEVMDSYKAGDVVMLLMVLDQSGDEMASLISPWAAERELVVRELTGASTICPEGYCLEVPLLNEEIMQVTGSSAAIPVYIPVDGNILGGLEFEPLEETSMKDFWEDMDCMSMMRLFPGEMGGDYVRIGSDCLVRYEDHRVVGICRQDVYYERFHGIVDKVLGIDPFFYIHSKAFNSPENVQVKMATLSFPNYETGEMLTQTLSRTDSQKLLDRLQTLVFEPDEILFGGAGCPFGGILTLRTSEGEFTFHVASDSCGVLCYEGNIYLDYGDQADLFELFPDCDPYSATYTWTGENAPRPATLEVLAADAPQWEIYEEDERIQELYDFIRERMATAETEPAKDGDDFLYLLDFRDETVAQILRVEVGAGSFKVDGRLYPDKKRELLMLIESLNETEAKAA